jgi:hypothetical protein
VEFLTPKLPPADLVCMDAPRGQLPSTATNGDVADRIITLDESGEDCRQRLARVRLKIETFNEVVAEVNAGKKPKK